MSGPEDQFVSLDQLVQNLNQVVQYLGRLITDLEGGSAQLWQPYNSLLTSVAALSGSLTIGNLIQGSGLGTVAALLQGTSGQFLKSQGTGSLLTFGDAVVSVALQVFTSNGTYTPTTGTLYSLLGTVGGGGGGGGAANSGAGNTGAGGGGGGGSTSLALKTAAQIGASQTVTIGAAANGGAAGNNNGTAGNDSSIGSLCVGKGGSQGAGAAAGGSGAGGAGGVAGTGSITVPGQAGIKGAAATITTYQSPQSPGGASGMGFGYGGPPSFYAAGSNGQNYGGGGSGGSSIAAGGAAAGGNGAQGLAFALDFCKV
jgi:hypothetical protein